MLSSLLYCTLLSVELIAAFCLAVYAVSMLFSYLKGVPYVSTKSKIVEEILKNAHLKKGQNFLELGCGDGRVVRGATKNYGVKGQGIDINFSLVLLARFLAKIEKIKNISFSTENVYKTDMSKADIIYLFLLPKVIAKLENQLLHDTKKDILIISHGFKIEYLQEYLIQTIYSPPFNTYFYKRPIDKSGHHFV